MSIIEAKLAGVRILGCSPAEFDNGDVGTHLLIVAADIKNLPPALVAWSSQQPLAELSAPWQGVDTEGPRMEWAGLPLMKAGDSSTALAHVCLKGVRIYQAVPGHPIETSCGSSIQVESDDLIGPARSLCEWDARKSESVLHSKWPGKVYTASYAARPARKETDVKPQEDKLKAADGPIANGVHS